MTQNFRHWKKTGGGSYFFSHFQCLKTFFLSTMDPISQADPMSEAAPAPRDISLSVHDPVNNELVLKTINVDKEMSLGQSMTISSMKTYLKLFL